MLCYMLYAIDMSHGLQCWYGWWSGMQCAVWRGNVRVLATDHHHLCCAVLCCAVVTTTDNSKLVLRCGLLWWCSITTVTTLAPCCSMPSVTCGD